MISAVSLRLLRIPLLKPYKLALGAVAHFDTMLCQLVAQKRAGIGEATILTGYSSETISESWRRAQIVAQKLPGLTIASGKELIACTLQQYPFTATMLTTALEMAQDHPALQVLAPVRVSLLAGINATDSKAVAAEIDAALVAGYQTLKIKVGFDLKRDLERVAFIQNYCQQRARLRIDANQGYSREEARRFASAIDPAAIELLEQPCAADDWDSLEAVAKVTAVPLMLDESIYVDTDIARAAAIGASFVKLKLMKCGSLDNLQRGIGLIRDCGMQPVLGNGVASDIGCWMEACVASKLISNAGEMNGFLRQAEALACPPQPVENGAMVLTANGAPQLDEAILAPVTLESVRFGRGSQSAKAVD